MTAAIVIASIVAISMQIYIAYLFGEVAKGKGYSGAKYYVVPFFFSVAGYLWIIALQDKTAAQAVSQSNPQNPVVSDELPDL